MCGEDARCVHLVCACCKDRCNVDFVARCVVCVCGIYRTGMCNRESARAGKTKMHACAWAQMNVFECVSV